jgi:2-oxopent-4-enoate/cis-2-oxohex-4-enoate hydratase
MDQARIEAHGEALYTALVERRTIAPLTTQAPAITIDDAYRVSLDLLARRTAAGERVVGKKIGVTSQAVMSMLNVHQPDFGFLTDRMIYGTGAEIPLRETLIQPRAEGEIAFLLKHDLAGPGVTVAEVLRATEVVMPCFEIVDSRITDWKIKIEDTIADNASCGVVVLGDRALAPTALDLSTCGIVVWLNGEIISTGAGAAALGSPLNSVCWLANTLGRRGMGLAAGEIILSGSLVPLQPVAPGDSMHLAIGGLGACAVRFT